MSKKTKFLSILLSTSLALSMISCNNSTKDESTNEDVTTAAPVELTISAAASLKESMADLEVLFKDDNPNVTLTFNFGASGSLQQQIEQGAPCDIFISAGKKQMTALEEGDLLLEDTNKDLVKNRLVLVGPSDTTITSIDEITTDDVTHIAVGEPSSVPAGKYADEVFESLGIKDLISDKLVFAKDVKEVLTWATTGNAEVGFVYLSDAMSNDSSTIITTIEEDLHSPITYPVAVIKSTKNADTAKSFEDFLFSDKAQEVFAKYGYSSAN